MRIRICIHFTRIRIQGLKNSGCGSGSRVWKSCWSRSWFSLLPKISAIYVNKVKKELSIRIKMRIRIKIQVLKKMWMRMRIRIQIHGLQKCRSNADPDPKPCPWLKCSYREGNIAQLLVISFDLPFSEGAWSDLQCTWPKSGAIIFALFWCRCGKLS